MAETVSALRSLGTGLDRLRRVADRLGGTRPITSQDRRRLAQEVERSIAEVSASGLEPEQRPVVDHTTNERPPRSVGAESWGDDGALADLATARDQLEQARAALQQAVDHARSADVSWRRIGQALGISGQSAHKRFDPQARRRHADRMRERYRSLRH